MNTSALPAIDFDGDKVPASEFGKGATPPYSRAQWLEWSKKHPQTMVNGGQVFDLFEGTEMNFPDEEYPTYLMISKQSQTTTLAPDFDGDVTHISSVNSRGSSLRK